MSGLKIATVQFENRSGDKEYNLSRIEYFSKLAVKQGANIVAFHECSITGYSFARHLTKEQLSKLAETIPGGKSIERLKKIAKDYKIAILVGLFEVDDKGDIYKAHVFIDETQVVKYRKLHPFINTHIKPGEELCVFDWKGWRLGILICYDNNIIENVRATRLLGAEVIFMPHVTMCTPSSRPGAGFVDPKLWLNRHEDPTSLRLEFDGLKGRKWLMKWLPARAYDNGVYVVFSNPIGMDDDQLKNGCSMVIDPFGDVIAECRKLDDDFVIAQISKQKLLDAGGQRYILARRPEIYRKIIGKKHTSFQKVAWMNQSDKSG